METISLYCESVEDISVVSPTSMEVTLAEVDIRQLVDEVGFENILSEMNEEDVLQYFEEKRELESE